jgi:urease accessory protein
MTNLDCLKAVGLQNFRLVSRPLWLLTVAAALLAASAAHAHSSTGLAGGFQAGFLHPLNGLDHMLAMVCVGLWGAILGRPLVIMLPVVFPAMMAIGGVWGMIGLTLPPVELGIALSVVILGSVIALAYRPPAFGAIMLVAIFALFHGFAHGQELPSAADPAGYSVGFVLATGLVHLAGVGLGFVTLEKIGLTPLRVIGGLIACSGVWFALQTDIMAQISSRLV